MYMSTHIQQYRQTDDNYNYYENDNSEQENDLENSQETGKDNPVNQILLMAISKNFYPITVNVVYRITEKYGNVLRIVVFKKNRVQKALVEFENVGTARLAKHELNGADIYAGCCTLSVTYATATRLNVYKNDANESWDFTMATWPGSAALTEGTTALVACGLSPFLLSCDRLLNLFCQYGNISAVKCCDRGMALVQLDDAVCADRAVYHLDGLQLFNTKITVSFYREKRPLDEYSTYNPVGGYSSFKSYVDSKNNRFQGATPNKNREPQSPSRVLHFYNTPPDLRKEDLHSIYNNAVNIRLMRNRSGKSSSGHLHFNTVKEAVEALVTTNHIPMLPKSTRVKYPYVTKLCFSTTMPHSAETTDPTYR